MQTENYNALIDRLRAMGVDDSLREPLQTQITGQKNSFSLGYKTVFDHHPLEVILFFSKWKDTDMYHLQKFHTRLRLDADIAPSEQEFYASQQEAPATLEAAYHLLCGRAIYRENLVSQNQVLYNAWIQLDFTQTDNRGNFKWHYFHDSYGYDLPAVLGRFPIWELTDEDAGQKLLEALKRGERVAVSMSIRGKTYTYYIEALPQFKSLRVYDERQHPLPPKTISGLVAITA